MTGIERGKGRGGAERSHEGDGGARWHFKILIWFSEGGVQRALSPNSLKSIFS